MSDEEEFVDESWTYMGPSPVTAGVYRWRDEAGDLMAYSKLKARAFGAIYTVPVKRADDSVYIPGNTDPRWTGQWAADSAVIEARALAVEEELALKRLEKNASRTTKIDEAAQPLLDLLGSMVNLSDRRTVLDYVSRKAYALSTRPNRKGN